MNKMNSRLITVLLPLLAWGWTALRPQPASAKQPPLVADSAFFRYPMPIEPELSGSFAELRRNHFHGGMDLRTKQREGIRVYSAAPGTIVRAGVSKVSYGKVLYVRHPNGMTTVYAHLSRFCAPVQRLVRKQQRKSGQYETDLRGLSIKTRNDKPIARSGNTGSSGGPHLHFEILQDSLRLNPALHGIRISDSVPPALLHLAFYSRDLPLEIARSISVPDADSLLQASFMDAPALDYVMEKVIIEERDSLQRLADRLSDTLYSRRAPFLSLPHVIDGEAYTARYFKGDSLPDTLYLHDRTAFGIHALDSIQHMPFHYGLYRLSFVILTEGKSEPDTLAFYQLDALSINTCAQIDQHLDMPFYEKTRKRLEKSWLDARQTFTPYIRTGNRGFLDPVPGKSYTLVIGMEDVSRNRTVVRIPLTSK